MHELREMIEHSLRNQEELLQAMWISNGLAILGRLIEIGIAIMLAHLVNRILNLKRRLEQAGVIPPVER
ncbi:MAG TPA: hypothetical protein VIM84_15470 [Gemmatimonadales bacterium]